MNSQETQRKLRMKSDQQIKVLNEFFNSHSEWTNEDINALGSQLKLTRSQIYKFLWNLRKKQQKAKVEVEEMSSEESGESYQKIEIEENIMINVPSGIKSAKNIYVGRKLSSWAETELKRSGWELVSYEKK